MERRSTAKRAAAAPQQLLVEGEDDQHVVWHLCERHKLPETFKVVTPGVPQEETGGIDELLKDVPVRLKTSGLRTLGIVVDADERPIDRWRQLLGRLVALGWLFREFRAAWCIGAKSGGQ